MSDPWVEASKNLELVIRASFDDADRALALIGTEGVNTVRRMVTNPSPSQPGEPPGLITGGLRLSYKWEWRDRVGRFRSIAIGSDSTTLRPIDGRRVIYAGWLEVGTRHMLPRPHFRPAMLAVRQTMPAHFARAIANAQRRQARKLRAMKGQP